MLAGMAAKWRWRARRRAEGKPTDNPNMVCGPVQVVWHKFARYWDVEMREVPMAPGRYAMDPASMLERVDENTIMVVPTLGVTYTGSYEPVQELAKALDQLQAGTARGRDRQAGLVLGRGVRRTTRMARRAGRVPLPRDLAVPSSSARDDGEACFGSVSGPAST